MSNWIQTYTGKIFNYDDMKYENVCIEDIAHSLAFQCRWCGHSKRFYSVAEHSINVSKEFVDSNMQLLALLHDATETYITDMPSPLKHHVFEKIKPFEDKIEKIILKKFNLELNDNIHKQIKKADVRWLNIEYYNLFEQHFVPIDYQIRHLDCYNPQEAEQEFLKLFEKLWAIKK